MSPGEAGVDVPVLVDAGAWREPKASLTRSSTLAASSVLGSAMIVWIGFLLTRSTSWLPRRTTS